MPRLIALDLPGGPAFVAALRSVWDRGDAAFVVDRRLPPVAQEALLRAVGPHHVHRADGSSSLLGGVVEGADADPDRAADLEPDDALVVATSGSTGSPKLVVHTRTGLAAHALAVHRRLGVDPRTDRWLACLPLAHLGGLGVVVRSLLTDTGVDVVDGFSVEAVADAPGTMGSTLVSLVPTAIGRVDVAPYRWVVVGGSADPAWRAPNVVRTYGLTETGGGVVYDGVPLDGVEVEVDHTGAIRVRGPMLARGLRRADGTVDPLTADDGWLTTGDHGRWVDGRLVVDGRADELIVTGGENVWPAPVEAALEAHPAVAEAAVVGAPDPEWGQRVVAVVVPKNPAAPPTLDELRNHVRERLPAWCAPKDLRLTDHLPRTALGKVQRAALTQVQSKKDQDPRSPD